MTIDDVSNILGFLGGLGMFLYGMKLLSGGLQLSLIHISEPTRPY